MNEILFALWFFIPAGLANMSPVLANNVPLLRRFTQPLDFNKHYKGKRVFGDHKTFRGLFAGVIGGMLGGLVQLIIHVNFGWTLTASELVDYSNPNVVLIGAVLGAGALCGDAIKSFFKRQANVPSGKGWVPFDQIDFIVGGLVFVSPFVTLPVSTYVLILAIWLALHPVANVLGWILRLKDKPF